MAYTDYLDTVQKVYIAFFQRPADPEGLRYWAERLDAAGGDLTSIIDAYTNAPETIELYGEISEDNIGIIIGRIYQGLFGRDPEPEGLAYYIEGFKEGRFTPGSIALDILNGADNEDQLVIENKLAAANLFTEMIAGRPLTDPAFGHGNDAATYVGAADAQAARDMLSQVTEDADSVPSPESMKDLVKETIADPTDPIVDDGDGDGDGDGNGDGDGDGDQGGSNSGGNGGDNSNNNTTPIPPADPAFEVKVLVGDELVMSGVTFGGTATGPITFTLDNGMATFSRGGVQATTKVDMSDLSAIQIKLAPDQTLAPTAAQAHGLNINGAGNVTITGLNVAEAYNFSGILSDATATVTESGQLTATGLGEVGLIITGDVTATADYLAMGTFSIDQGSITVSEKDITYEQYSGLSRLINNLQFKYNTHITNVEGNAEGEATITAYVQMGDTRPSNNITGWMAGYESGLQLFLEDGVKDLTLNVSAPIADSNKGVDLSLNGSGVISLETFNAENSTAGIWLDAKDTSGGLALKTVTLGKGDDYLTLHGRSWTGEDGVLTIDLSKGGDDILAFAGSTTSDRTVFLKGYEGANDYIDLSGLTSGKVHIYENEGQIKIGSDTFIEFDDSDPVGLIRVKAGSDQFDGSALVKTNTSGGVADLTGDFIVLTGGAGADAITASEDLRIGPTNFAIFSSTHTKAITGSAGNDLIIFTSASHDARITFAGTSFGYDAINFMDGVHADTRLVFDAAYTGLDWTWDNDASAWKAGEGGIHTITEISGTTGYLVRFDIAASGVATSSVALLGVTETELNGLLGIGLPPLPPP